MWMNSSCDIGSLSRTSWCRMPACWQGSRPCTPTGTPFGINCHCWGSDKHKSTLEFEQIIFAFCFVPTMNRENPFAALYVKNTTRLWRMKNGFEKGILGNTKWISQTHTHTHGGHPDQQDNQLIKWDHFSEQDAAIVYWEVDWRSISYSARCLTKHIIWIYLQRLRHHGIGSAYAGVCWYQVLCNYTTAALASLLECSLHCLSIYNVNNKSWLVDTSVALMDILICTNVFITA